MIILQRRADDADDCEEIGIEKEKKDVTAVALRNNDINLVPPLIAIKMK
jgi:hypothetical protein